MHTRAQGIPAPPESGNACACAPTMAATAPGAPSMHLRVYRPPARPRSGRLVPVLQATVHPAADGRDIVGVTGVGLYSTLAPLIDISQETPYTFDGSTGTFAAVRAAPGHFYEAGEAGVLDVRLSPATGARPQAPAQVAAAAAGFEQTPPAPPVGFARAMEMTRPPPPPPASPPDESEHRPARPQSQPAPPPQRSPPHQRRPARGVCEPIASPPGAWCGIGLPRTSSSDLSAVARSAAQLGASYVFSVGGRQRSAPKAPRSLPCFTYDSPAGFLAATPADAVVVAVVPSVGIPLGEFAHPKRAVYLLATDDAPIPDDLLAVAQHAVTIPAALGRPMCIGAGAVAAVLLWDRAFKHMALASVAKDTRRKRQSAPSRESVGDIPSSDSAAS